MIAALDGWAYDYMMEMLTPIMNLISKVIPFDILLHPSPLDLLSSSLALGHCNFRSRILPRHFLRHHGGECLHQSSRAREVSRLSLLSSSSQLGSS
jgi:hypothetical protein